MLFKFDAVYVELEIAFEFLMLIYHKDRFRSLGWNDLSKKAENIFSQAMCKQTTVLNRASKAEIRRLIVCSCSQNVAICYQYQVIDSGLLHCGTYFSS